MMAALRKSVTCSLPVVVVLGSTGAGKSKLAIQIAKKFNGEIISADSMQVYQGLDIVTNKVTAEEQAQCRHHLLDYVSPLHSHYTVTDFQQAALPIIAGLLERRTLPVVVGGTNYYIESLLWNYLLTVAQNDGPSDRKQCKLERTEPLSTSKSTVYPRERLIHPDCTPDSSQCVESGINVPRVTDLNVESAEKSWIVPSKRLSEENLKENNDERHTCDTKEADTAATCTSSKEEFVQGKELLEGNDTRSLHSRLMSVDPESGLRIHPKDRRKIIRALEVYDQRGVTRSDLYRRQHGAQGSQALSGPLRYPNVCVLWIQCQQSVLDSRLDGRVEDMMSRGLVGELEDFHQSYHTLRQATPHSEIDYTLGIFQNIGFKEFHQYLILPEEEKSSDKGRKLLAEGVEKLKQVTRKYSRKQTRWITNRFLKRPGTATCPVYGLDGTDITRWEESVESPAMEIVSAIIQGRTPAQEPLPLEPQSKNLREHNVCEICDKVFITQKEWTAHMTSRKHKRAVERKRKQDLGLTYLKRLPADETIQPEESRTASSDVT